jgi:PAS domain-containing protein
MKSEYDGRVGSTSKFRPLPAESLESTSPTVGLKWSLNCNHCQMPRELLEKTQTELSLLQFALDYVSDCVHWMNAQGRILYVNEASCRSLERSREELLSLSIPDIDPLFPQERWPRSGRS